MDGVRRRARSRTDEGYDEALIALVSSEEPGPEELTSAAYTRERLDRAWAELKPEQRALLAMHAEGYGLAELEKILGKNRNLLSARLHRARARLAKLIGDDVRAAVGAPCLESES